jgi:hypothetical protein
MLRQRDLVQRRGLAFLFGAKLNALKFLGHQALHLFGAHSVITGEVCTSPLEMLHRQRAGTTTGTSNDPGCFQPEPQEDHAPRDERIVAIGLLTKGDSASSPSRTT